MKKLLLVLSLLFSIGAFARTSEEIRAEKTLEVYYKGGYDYRMGTNQVGFSYFLNARNLLGARVGAASSDGERQTNITVDYKYFLSNSFYVAPEVFYLNTVEDEAWFLTPFFKQSTVKYTSMGAGFRIGNQWSGEHFSFGVDWVGIGRRLGTFHKDSDVVNNTTVTVLNLTLAFHF